jgi:hypothetical protein
LQRKRKTIICSAVIWQRESHLESTIDGSKRHLLKIKYQHKLVQYEIVSSGRLFIYFPRSFISDKENAIVENAANNIVVV